MPHNTCVIDCKNAYKEDGPNIEFEVSFDSPDCSIDSAARVLTSWRR